MLGRLNHVAIAVKDAEKAAKIYGGAFGAEISGAVPLPEHGVITVFVTLPNTKIEFIQPLGEASPIAKFVERNADGGIHHICYDVPDIIAARDKLISEGARVLGDGVPKITAEISVVQSSFQPIRAMTGAPGSVPGAPSPSSCWLRTPNGSVVNSTIHHRTK